MGVLIGGVTKTVKDEIKKHSLVQPVISSVVKSMSGRGVKRAERGYMNKSF